MLRVGLDDANSRDSVMTDVVHLNTGGQTLCGLEPDPDVNIVLHIDLMYLLKKSGMLICPSCSEQLPMAQLAETAL